MPFYYILTGLSEIYMCSSSESFSGLSVAILQKELFAGILQNRCFWKFCNNHRKTPVLESLFNKFAGIPVKKKKTPRGESIEHLWWLLLLSGDFLQLHLAGVDQYMQMFKIVLLCQRLYILWFYIICLNLLSHQKPWDSKVTMTLSVC